MAERKAEEEKMAAKAPKPMKVEIKPLEPELDDMSFNEEEVFSHSYNPFSPPQDLPKIST